MMRVALNVNTDTGTQGDTGPVMSGEIRQMQWAPTTADTGADLYLAVINVQGDTAGGFQLYSRADILGSGFVRAPVIPGFTSDGFDTGVDDYFPPVTAGGRLRMKVTPGGAAVAGTLYVWSSDAA